MEEEFDIVVENEEPIDVTTELENDFLKGDKGDKGDPTATIEINEVLTGEEGTDASIENIGTKVNMKLNITIPRGDKGEQGEKGDTASEVTISPTEPTTGEKVWIQKGKNKFDKNNVSSAEVYVNISGTSAGVSEGNYAIYIKCKENTTYTISSSVAVPRFRACSYTTLITTSVAVAGVVNDGGSAITLTTGSNDKYLYVNLTDSSYLDYLQIQQGPTATEYEEYIEPAIYVKNDNGIFEEFVNVNTINNKFNEVDTSIESIVSNQFKSVSRGGSTDFNDFIKNGFYMINVQNATNAPSDYATGMLLVFGSYYISQLYIANLNGVTVVYARTSSDKGVSWNSWSQFA